VLKATPCQIQAGGIANRLNAIKRESFRMADSGTARKTPLYALEWRISDSLIDYPAAIAEMEARVAAIRAGTAPEMAWLLEHPPLYTLGTSAKPADLLLPNALPVY
jgi:lipoyl(octanoyl) transferase